MRDKSLESDWKTFRKRVPEWRERYLERTNKAIIALLSDQTKTPTEQFWDAKDKMQEEAKILRDCLDGHSRSEMMLFLVAMYNHNLINDNDLEEFSEELRETLSKLSSLRACRVLCAHPTASNKSKSDAYGFPR